jgi:hypothetical protein
MSAPAAPSFDVKGFMRRASRHWLFGRINFDSVRYVVVCLLVYFIFGAAIGLTVTQVTWSRTQVTGSAVIQILVMLGFSLCVGCGARCAATHPARALSVLARAQPLVSRELHLQSVTCLRLCGCVSCAANNRAPDFGARMHDPTRAAYKGIDTNSTASCLASKGAESSFGSFRDSTHDVPQ